MMAATFVGQTVVITQGFNPLGQHLAQRFTAEGAHVILANADPAHYAALVEQSVREYGQLDIWINYPSLGRFGPAETLPEADWNATLADTLSIPFVGAQAAGRQMLAQGHGVIVNVATVAGYKPQANQAACSVAQAGLIALTQALGVEWAGRGVRVAGVALGSPAETSAAMARRIPLRRGGTLEEMAEAVLFVAGPEASFVVGETLRVDGGWTAYQLF